MAQFLVSCGNDDDDDGIIWSPVYGYEFSENDIVVGNGEQTVNIKVTPEEKDGTWYVLFVEVVSGDNMKTYSNVSAPAVTGRADFIDREGFANDIFNIKKLNDGLNMQIKLTKNPSAVDRIFYIRISNGWNGSGSLTITQKAQN